jgi:hypothetical protein
MLPVKERFPLKRKVMTHRKALRLVSNEEGPLWLRSYSARHWAI